MTHAHFRPTNGLLVALFLLTIRAGSLAVPIMNTPFSNMSDALWRVLAPSQATKYGTFSERFGQSDEGYIHSIRSISAAIKNGVWSELILGPFLGEPIQIPTMIRKFPEIKSVGISNILASNIELYQRIEEGVYPVLISEGTTGSFRLIGPSEESSCFKMDMVKEATLVRCP